MEGGIFITDRVNGKLFADRIVIKSDGRVRKIKLKEWIEGKIEVLAKSDTFDKLVCVVVENKSLKIAFRLKDIRPGLERKTTGQDFYSGKFVPWVCALISFGQETSLKEKMEKAIAGID